MKTEDVRLLSRPTPDATPSLELTATLYLPEGAGAAPAGGALLPGLIVGHGAGSERIRHKEFCKVACEAGFAVLGLDFRGHGGSAGMADGPLELDIYAAVNFLQAHPIVDPGKIAYRASSMGGFYGLKAAKEAGLAAAVLVCPATESVMMHGIDEHEGQSSSPDDPSPRWDFAQMRAYFQEQDALLMARSVKCPVLLIHARSDEVVPLTHTLLLTQALPVDTTLWAQAEGTHTTAQHDPRLHRLTVAWLWEALGLQA